MCTNESVVHFGMGQSPRVDRIEIHWPSGHKQQINDLPPIDAS